MSNRILPLLIVAFIWGSCTAIGSGSESQETCHLDQLKQSSEAYYNAVNTEHQEDMSSFESEEYKQNQPASVLEPELLKMKRVGKFDKLAVKHVRLESADTATVVVNLIIHNKTENVWYTEGSFQQLWKCQNGLWKVKTLPTVILLGK